VHPRHHDTVIVAVDASKAIGGADDPDHEHERYAKQIVRISRESEFPEFHRSRITSKEEAHANALLIAAAPEMLAALNQIYAWILDGGDPGEFAHPLFVKSYRLAEAAIAKAEGKAHV
jgi:hypothetical protein